MPLAIKVFHPRNPGDTRELREALDRLPADRVRRLAVFGKTEGPATLNDYSRDLAQLAVDAAIHEVGGTALLERTTRLFSTGCVGVASPITVLLADIEGDASHRDGLAFGAAVSEPVPDGERAGPVHIAAAQDTLIRACKDAGLTAAQVGLVLIKSPILSPAQAARQTIRKRHGGSTGSSRGAAAIGAGLALGEIDPRALDDDPVGRAGVHARHVMAFSGTEVDRVEVIVIGTRPGGDPRWAIRAKLLQDLADGDALRAMRTDAGGGLMLALFKAGIAADGRLRGRRTTVLTSDLTPDKQLRAAASGVIAACLGGVDAFISAGAEHQGPPGACLCALIVRNDSATL
jgi:cyanuric acid amidohydrolase